MPRYITKKQRIGIALAVCVTTTSNSKIWTKKWLLQRKRFSHIILLKELESDDFKNFLRMDHNSFKILLNLVTPIIIKQNTTMRQAVTAEERLVATLRFLATGREYADLKFSSAISPQLLSKIIPETCEAIFKVLNKYIQLPTTESEWMSIADQFEQMWQFNNCVGVMDGKHILINKPPGTGSKYYNYKGTFSVVLFAVVNANYEFMYVHTGVNGSVSDGGIIKQTKFYEKLLSGDLNLPAPTLLPGVNNSAPFVFLGDSAFALSKNILKPYPQKNLTKEKRIFNYRLSRARRVVENVFGILASRFRVFQKPILIEVNKIDWVVLASCALHNFLRKSSYNYMTTNCIDHEDVENATFREADWRHQNHMLQLDRNSQRQHTEDERIVRTIFMEYFNDKGRVSFQERMINLLGENIK